MRILTYTQQQKKHTTKIFSIIFGIFFKSKTVCRCTTDCWLANRLKTQNHFSVTSVYVQIGEIWGGSIILHQTLVLEYSKWIMTICTKAYIGWILLELAEISRIHFHVDEKIVPLVDSRHFIQASIETSSRCLFHIKYSYIKVHLEPNINVWKMYMVWCWNVICDWMSIGC